MPDKNRKTTHDAPVALPPHVRRQREKAERDANRVAARDASRDPAKSPARQSFDSKVRWFYRGVAVITAFALVLGIYWTFRLLSNDADVVESRVAASRANISTALEDEKTYAKSLNDSGILKEPYFSASSTEYEEFRAVIAKQTRAEVLADMEGVRATLSSVFIPSLAPDEKVDALADTYEKNIESLSDAQADAITVQTIEDVTAGVEPVWASYKPAVTTPDNAGDAAIIRRHVARVSELAPDYFEAR